MDPKTSAARVLCASPQPATSETRSTPRAQIRSDARADHRAQAPFPSIDEHLVEPEVSRFEIIRGREVDVPGAEPPHADAQARLAFLIAAHVATGFIVSTELLTRMAQGSDFATDVCVRKGGVDPRTDQRYLEEVVFEIVNTQKKRDVTDKAEDMVCRGVRRAFAIFVKTGQVGEWSKSKGEFVLFDRDAFLTDPVFVRPIPVQALLDRAAGENEAALALIAKRNPAIVELTQNATKKGLDEGLKKGHRKGLDEGHKKGLDEGLKKGLDEGHKKGLDEGHKKGLDEGHKKGLDEGLKKGVDEGRRLMFLEQLADRFGDVPSEVETRIHTAGTEELRAWSKKVLFASCLDDVFH